MSKRPVVMYDPETKEAFLNIGLGYTIVDVSAPEIDDRTRAWLIRRFYGAHIIEIHTSITSSMGNNSSKWTEWTVRAVIRILVKGIVHREEEYWGPFLMWHQCHTADEKLCIRVFGEVFNSTNMQLLIRPV